MARCVFNIFAAISLLCCLAICALWIRSYPVSDFLCIYMETRTLMVYSDRGGISLIRLPESRRFDPETAYFAGVLYHYNASTDLQARGGGTMWKSERLWFAFAKDSEFWMLTIPLWPFVLVSSGLPIFWFIRRKRRFHRQLTSLCLNCGYDLRATPERCPECGAVPVPAK